MDEVERLKTALATAVGIIRHNHQTVMAAMATEQEIERSWQHYLKTDPEMRQIIAAICGE